jgi:hypothetical protein
MRYPRLAAAAVTALAAIGAGLPGNAARAADPDPLVTLNKSFLQAYTGARAALLARGGPVIVVAFDDLIMWRNGKMQKAHFTPAIYHEAKAIAHVPLALYVWFQARTDKPLDAAFLATLRDYRAKVVAGADSLPNRPNWTNAALKLHRRIIAASLKLIDEALDKKRISARRLRAYTRAMGRPLLASAALAARAQLNGLDALMQRWRKALGKDWRRTNVVVLTSRQARRDNLQYLYFLALMGRAAHGKRLFYGTNIFSAAGGQRLAGTIQLDRGASVAFFRDPKRLERDLLGDAAKRYIARLFARRR